MSVDNEELALPLEELPQEETQSLTDGLKLFVGVIIRPRQTFRKLRDATYGYWGVMFAISVLIGFIYSIIDEPFWLETAEVMIRVDYEDRYERDFDDLLPRTRRAYEEEIEDLYDNASRSFVYSLVYSIGFALVSYLVGAAAIYFGGSMLGAQTTFKQSFWLSVWATTPSDVVGGIVHAITMLVTGRMAVSGLTTLISLARITEEQYPLWALLARIDIFTIWTLILLYIGISQVLNLDRNKSITLAAIYWGASLVPSALSILRVLLFSTE